MNDIISNNGLDGAIQTIGDFVNGFRRYKKVVIPLIAGILSAWIVYKAMKGD